MSAEYSYEISYGKLHVPLYRVYARPLTGVAPIPESAFVGRGNVLLALEVDLEVFGDTFLAAYTEGDNSRVVATDSMKNIILQQALAYDGATLEGLLEHIGRHFLAIYTDMEALRLTVHERPFAPAHVPSSKGDGFADSHVLFSLTHGDHTVAVLEMTRGAEGGALIADHRCGRVGLELLKVTGSAFTHFVRDA